MAPPMEVGLMRSVPFSCIPCRDSGWPTSLLVFGDGPIPECKYHLVPMTRSPHYDESGNRIAKTPTEDE